MKLSNLFFVAIMVFALQSCQTLVPEEPKVTFRHNNVLMPEINFETKDETEVTIEFWPEQNSAKKRVSKTSKGKQHTVVIINLTEKTKYQYQVVTADGQRSDVFSFETGEIPAEVFKMRKDKADTTVFDGYMLIRRFHKSGADAIINNAGDIVWYHVYDTVIRRPNYFTDKGHILSIYDSAVVTEIDLYGNEIFKYNLEKFDISNKIHHELIYDSQGNMVTLTLDSAEMDLTKFGGKKRQYLRADGILVISKEGKKVWEWNMLDVAKPDPKKDSIDLRDSWGHANSLVIDTDGHYLVSFRDLSQVWKVDSKTGALLWRLGKDGDFKMPDSAYFIRQHSINFTEPKTLLMFDNGSQNKRPQSRVVELLLHEDEKVAEPKTLITLPRALSSYRMCSADKISDSKYLICTTRKDATLVVVDRTGSILWKVVADNASYRAYYIEDPFRRY